MSDQNAQGTNPFEEVAAAEMELAAAQARLDGSPACRMRRPVPRSGAADAACRAAAGRGASGRHGSATWGGAVELRRSTDGCRPAERRAAASCRPIFRYRAAIHASATRAGDPAAPWPINLHRARLRLQFRGEGSCGGWFVGHLPGLFGRA